MSEIDIAFEWGMLPSFLGICKPSEDLAYMTAYIETKRTMEFVDTYIAEAEAEKNK